MAGLKRVQRLGHTTALADAFTGLAREITVDVTKNTLRVHDGNTQGGHEAAKDDLSNSTAATNSNLGHATSIHITELESLRTDLTAAEADIVTNAAAVAGLGTASALDVGDILDYGIETGTKAPFYQAAAPLTWTRDVTVDDVIAGIVSAGSPGSTGGSWTISGLTTPATSTGTGDNPDDASDGTGVSFFFNTTNHTHVLPSMAVASDAVWRPATAYFLLATKDAP